MTETSVAPSRSDVEQAVRFAVRAPSIHNTQPWRWVFRNGVLELSADRSRQLPALDPDGHSLLLSCGGALALAQLGFAAAGWSSEVDRTPDPDRPDLLARIRPLAHTPVTPSTVELARAAERRHSERLPFSHGPVPAAMVDALLGLDQIRRLSARSFVDVTAEPSLTTIGFASYLQVQLARGYPLALAALFAAESVYYLTWSSVRAEADRSTPYWHLIEHWSSEPYGNWMSGLGRLMNAAAADGPSPETFRVFDRVVRFEIAFFEAIYQS